MHTHGQQQHMFRLKNQAALRSEQHALNLQEIYYPLPIEQRSVQAPSCTLPTSFLTALHPLFMQSVSQ
jgi:hypothetical protein